MPNRDIEVFVRLKNKFTSELHEVEAEIIKLQMDLAPLEQRRSELNDILDGTIDTTVDVVLVPFEDEEEAAPRKSSKAKPEIPSPEVRLLAYLKKNPGSDRQTIMPAINVDGETYKLLVSKLARRGIIVNKGSKRHGEWHLVEA